MNPLTLTFDLLIPYTFMPLLIAVKSHCSVCWTSVPFSTALTTTFSSNDSSSCLIFTETCSHGLGRSSTDAASMSSTTVSCRLSWSSCLEYYRARFSARCCFCCTLQSCLTSLRVSALSATRTPMILTCTSALWPRRHRPLLSASLRA